jgi:hypothetical protein
VLFGIFTKLSAVSGRFLFACAALLVFANAAFGDGTYQRTKNGKTLVWNNDPKPGDEAKWSGDRDREDYASGFGTLTWYRPQKSETDSAKSALYMRYWGNMVRGKFSGPVNAHSKGKTDHAIFVDGVQTTRWAAGPAPSQIVAEPAQRLAGANPETPNVQRPTEALPPRPAAEEVVVQPENLQPATANVQRAIPETPAGNPSTTPAERHVAKQDNVERQKSNSERPIAEAPGDGPSTNQPEAENAQLSTLNSQRSTQDTSADGPSVARIVAKSENAERPTTVERGGLSNAQRPIEDTPEKPVRTPPTANEPSAEVDDSLRALVGPPSSLRTNPVAGAASVGAKPETASSPGANPHLSQEEVTDLADAEARAQGYNLDEYQRPKADYSAVEDKWSLFYDQKPVDGMPEIGKYFSATVDDKTKKVEVKK